MLLSGNIVDLHQNKIYPGTVEIRNGIIQSIQSTPDKSYTSYLTPGLVDAHVHVESSMLPPTEFARMACAHGTVASVSDPHEIANVLGIPGVQWMLDDAAQTPFKCYFGAPSCVPATPFETAGAQFGPEEVEALLKLPEIKYLAEVMNFPAVIHRDERMMAIVDVAKRLGKNIDGHAPGVMSEALEKYCAAGIETDHECVTLEEGRARIALGMKVAIREGSAAKNFEALWPLVKESPHSVFLCSDDKHPDDLVHGHINQLLARLVANGISPLDALRTATLNPVKHYGLEVGLLREGDPADIVEWQNLTDFTATKTWIQGELVAEAGKPLHAFRATTPINNFNTDSKTEKDFAYPASEQTQLKAIVALDGQLLTDEQPVSAKIEKGLALADPQNDLLKITVVNRYQNAPPAVAFIKNFGLKNGAMASTVAHDSHNIVAVGTDDAQLCQAVNLLIENQGGLSTVFDSKTEVLPLPIAGLMSTENGWEIAQKFEKMTEQVKAHGCQLTSPFMTLSFMALLVIPKLKLGDLGLFDVDRFALVDANE